jgi:hypothetical protein
MRRGSGTGGKKPPLTTGELVARWSDSTERTEREALIQGLGAALVKADKGSMSMKRTGNPLADAMFQQMGFKLTP